MVRIGVTGHRCLLCDKIDMITRSVREGVTCLVKKASAEKPADAVEIYILSLLAEGGDRIIVREVMKIASDGHNYKTTLEIVLPFPLEMYVEDFDSPESKNLFQEYMGQTTSIVVIGSVPSREEAYELAGHYVVDHCDILIAIWNGEKASGRGGTGDIVEYARKMARPILWIDSVTGTLNRERL